MKSLNPWFLSAGLGLLLVACREPDGGGGDLNEVREVGVDVEMPFDATPTPKADAVFFTAMTKEEGGALFKIGTAAGSTPTKIASGFIAPTSLVMSTDGATVYVSDLGSLDEDAPESAGAPVGAIYAVPAGGGDFAIVEATAGYNPRSLDLVAVGGNDVLYFSGNSPTSGAAGVYSLPVAGGELAVVYEGDALHEPSGIAVSSDGDVYVVDALAAGGGATVVRIADGAAEEFVAGLRVGYPAGIALTHPEDRIVVSGLKPAGSSALVYRIDVANPDTIVTVDMGIAQNTESAGVHRAHEADIFAWADLDAPGGVYLLGTKKNPLP